MVKKPPCKTKCRLVFMGRQDIMDDHGLIRAFRFECEYCQTSWWVKRAHLRNCLLGRSPIPLWQ